MQVIATNIGESREVLWNGEKIVTGIFKKFLALGIYLGLEEVENDHVIDRKHHGGVDKACYAFSIDNYEKWESKYPDLTFEHGMFGENLTITDLNEEDLFIGSIYKVGTAEIQVSEPRQPCFKLNIRFNSKYAVKDFLKFGNSGVYFRVIKPGHVSPNDSLTLLSEPQQKLSIHALFKVINNKPSEEEITTILTNKNLSETMRKDLSKKWL